MYAPAKMSSRTRPTINGFFDLVVSSITNFLGIRMLKSSAKSDKRFCGVGRDAALRRPRIKNRML